jgi:hypothetical protein
MGWLKWLNLGRLLARIVVSQTKTTKDDAVVDAVDAVAETLEGKQDDPAPP